MLCHHACERSNAGQQVHRGPDRGSPAGAEKGGPKFEALCRTRWITAQTDYRWRKKCGGIEMSDVRKMLQLEHDNAQLKQFLAEWELDIAALKAVVPKK